MADVAESAAEFSRVLRLIFSNLDFFLAVYPPHRRLVPWDVFFGAPPWAHGSGAAGPTPLPSGLTGERGGGVACWAERVAEEPTTCSLDIDVYCPVLCGSSGGGGEVTRIIPETANICT